MTAGGAEAEPAAVIARALRDLALSYENPSPGAYLVKLEGQHKLATMTWLIAGQHSLHVEAFFCRKPDENHERFYRFLLERNGRTYGVHFAIDPVGDVYLVGRLPLTAAAPGEIDRILGCVLSYSDENFDAAPGAWLRVRHPEGMGLAGQKWREPGQPACVRPVRGPRCGRATRRARGDPEFTAMTGTPRS